MGRLCICPTKSRRLTKSSGDGVGRRFRDPAALPVSLRDAARCGTAARVGIACAHSNPHPSRLQDPENRLRTESGVPCTPSLSSSRILFARAPSINNASMRFPAEAHDLRRHWPKPPSWPFRVATGAPIGGRHELPSSSRQTLHVRGAGLEVVSLSGNPGCAWNQSPELSAKKTS